MTFKEWLQTKEGKAAMSWPVTDTQYLENRLWHAFHAGNGELVPDAEHSQFTNSEQARHTDTSTTTQEKT